MDLYGSSMFILQVVAALEGTQWSLALHLSTSIPAKSCSLASLNAASSGMTNASLDISPQNHHVYPVLISSMHQSFVDIYVCLARKWVSVCADNVFILAIELHVSYVTYNALYVCIYLFLNI